MMVGLGIGGRDGTDEYEEGDGRKNEMGLTSWRLDDPYQPAEPDPS